MVSLFVLEQFIAKYNGKFVEVGGSANAINQCVDLLRKLSVVFQSSILPNLPSFFNRFVISQIKIFSTNHKSNTIGLLKRSIRNFRNTPSAIAGMIKRVLLVCRNSQVSSSIVKRVVVNVVDLHSGRCIGNYSVHKEPFLPSLPRTISPVFGSSSISITGKPFMFAQPFIVTIINNCSLTLCQLDIFHSKYYITSTHL